MQQAALPFLPSLFKHLLPAHLGRAVSQFLRLTKLLLRVSRHLLQMPDLVCRIADQHLCLVSLQPAYSSSDRYPPVRSQPFQAYSPRREYLVPKFVAVLPAICYFLRYPCTLNYKIRVN